MGCKQENQKSTAYMRVISRRTEALQLLEIGNYFEGGGDGGSVGGTPHSGRPLGRWMRLGSQSSPAAALSR